MLRCLTSRLIPTYSFSYNFNYWKRCKYSVKTDLDGRATKDLYVFPKYLSLKDELLNNSISTFDITFINKKINDAQYQQQSYQCLSLTRANVSAFATSDDDDPAHRGYIDGNIMKIEHLMVIIIYCGQDVKFL